MLDNLRHLSTDAIRTELLRRDEPAEPRPACGSGPQKSYNTSLHVFALFLILFLSTLGMSPWSLALLFG